MAAAEAAGRIVEFALARAVVRAFGRSIQGHWKLDAGLCEQRDAAPGIAAFILIIQLAFTIILLFGTSLALCGDIHVTELLALLVLALRYVELLAAAANLSGALRISRNSLSRMDEYFAAATFVTCQAESCLLISVKSPI